MKLSDISIERPVLATVMNLFVVVAGVAGYFALPVREYPDVDRPVVSITTVYRGASPATVERSVTEPIEQVLNGIEGVRTIASSSSMGLSTIDVEFLSGRDIDIAATDVSNAVQRALRNLPVDAERPVVSKAGSNNIPIMWLQLKGENYSPVDLTDLAERNVKPQLQTIPGVAQVIIGGQRRFAMRVWLDPLLMAVHRVDALDVRRAILENNIELPVGEIEAAARKFTVNADARIDDPRVFEAIIIREDGDQLVRIRDVGWVELGSANYQTITRFNQEPIIGIGILRQSRANELATARTILNSLPSLRAMLPEDVRLDVAVNNTVFVEESLKEVWETLAIAFVIVVLVNLFFLRSAAATFIASVSIPVSLIGTFAFLRAFEFSINVLTLLALVLAIGLLVDDAIVVLENVYRRRELGESRLRAALNGSREVGFAVVATSVSVVAVLVPLSLMTGNTGRLFREFAVTVAIAVLISTFVALTLVPMLCSRILVVGTRRGTIAAYIEQILDALGRTYDRSLRWSLAHRPFVGLFLVIVFAGIAVLFTLLPRTLVPVEDRGVFMTFIRAPQGSTATYTMRALKRVEEELANVPEVRGFFAAIGLGVAGPANTAQGVVFARLHHWAKRRTKQQQIVGQLTPKFFAIPEALVFAVNPPSLGHRNASDLEVILKSSTASPEEFAEVIQRLLPRIREVPGLVNVDTDLRLENPQLDVVFDRERAADVGISLRAVAETMQFLVSEAKADEFVLRNKQYDVIMGLATRYRSVPEQLGEVHIRAPNDTMLPLSAIIETRPRTAPASLNHFDLQRSASISAGLAPGSALGEALDRVQDIIRSELSDGFSMALGGLSREFVETSGEVYLTFAAALVVIYLVLAAQFESFIHPFTVMFSVPLASLGALITLWLMGGSINLYSQIGMILLIGLVTKNSILLVDFANQERARGTELVESLYRTGKTRFRPIMMTSVTSILGSLPLLLAAGAGAESRQPIGGAVVGGLLFSTVFTLVVIPVVYYAVIRLAERMGFNTVPPLVELHADAVL